MTVPAETTERCDPREGRCHLCGDEAEAGRVLEIDAAQRIATVMLQGGTALVALDLVDAEVGDAVLVHLGFAIERLGVV
ncbi:MAG: HypC/HybG/HupF family hydrogenase formation chaperone [Gemmatimonadaceae bacterium]